MEAFAKAQDWIIPFVLLFMPGFVSMQVMDLRIGTVGRDYGKIVYQVVAYSLLNYAVWLGPLAWYYSKPAHQHFDDAFVLWALCVLLVTPICWPLLYLRLWKIPWIAMRVSGPIPTAWEYVFGLSEAFIVLVHLKSGVTLAGSYEYGSFATTHPLPHDLYLKNAYVVDPASALPAAKTKHTRGLWISADAVEYIEFFTPDVRSSARKKDKNDTPQGAPERTTA